MFLALCSHAVSCGMCLLTRLQPAELYMPCEPLASFFFLQRGMVAVVGHFNSLFFLLKILSVSQLCYDV